MPDPIVEIEHLTKRYGAVQAVSDVSVRIDEGASFGYLGPNGAGKTTTIRCMLGFITPTSGRIRVFGRPVERDLPSILRTVGYLPGEFGIWPQLTGREALTYLGDLHPEAPVDRDALCDRFEMGTADLDRPVRHYSRGMRQKIGIIQAFQHRPKLVVLDEPTEGLDPVMKDRFVSLLKEHRAAGGSVFLSSHILSEVELATDQVAILKQGRVVHTGSARDLTGERIRRCSLVLRNPLPAGALDIPGVDRLQTNGATATFEFRGDMGPLVDVLAQLDVVEFLAEPQSLADAFFDIFQENR